MKNKIIEKDKIKTSLMTRLKMNRKSIQLLKPLNILQNTDLFKSNTSRKDKLKRRTFNTNYNFTSNIFSTNIKNIKTDSESETSFKIKKDKEEFKDLPILSERSSNKINIKLNLNSNKKKKKYESRNNNNLSLNSPFMTLSQRSNKDYIRNINKYKQIFNSVSSRVKNSCHKTVPSYKNNHLIKNYSSKNLNINYYHSPNKKRYSLKNANKSNLINSSVRKPQLKFDDYSKTLNKEFNTQELINIENRQIKQRLKDLKIKVYDKTPLFDTTEKLNIYLGREFNLDIRNLKKSFNKKYKVYTSSLNKIREIKHKSLFSNNNVFGFKISLDKDKIVNDYNYKYSEFDTKDALKNFYRYKAKDMLNKKIDLEKQLIELENKFSYIIEQEKAEKNRLGINYGEINQVIQKKFLYREIYELDRMKQKQQFNDEQTKILYQTRNYIQNKVLRETLKQNTINKFKDITGVHFG